MTTEADTPEPAQRFPRVTASKEGLLIGDDLLIPGRLVGRNVGYEKKWRPEGSEIVRDTIHIQLFVSGFTDGGVADVTEVEEEPWHPGMEGYESTE